MPSALQITRAIRETGYSPPGPNAPPPPPFLVKPTTVARAAVGVYHRQGAASARRYLHGKMKAWLNHANPSMAGNARNTVDGLDYYIASDGEDGRPMLELARKTVVVLPSGSIDVRIDVFLGDASGVAGRVVLWDGPDFHPDVAPVMAAAYAKALLSLYPERAATTLGIWQARRGRVAEVDVSAALAQLPAADAVLSQL
jgi:hypothetical protein